MSRKKEYPVDDMFIERWSARAIADKPISKDQLMSLFEAARWAPSSYNNQPWRFIYAMRGTKEWETFFDLLVDFNKQWAKNAAALIVIFSKNNFELNNKPSRTHLFDTGAAWMSLALQGFKMGLVVHAMEGFDYQKARTELQIPEDYTIACMVAVGYPGSKEALSDELQEKERTKSDRKKVEEFVYKGFFGL